MNLSEPSFFGTSSKGTFSIILFCSYSLKTSSYFSIKFFDVKRFFNFISFVHTLKNYPVKIHGLKGNFVTYLCPL